MNLTKEDFLALFKGLVIALIGAALTYLTEWVTKSDFGTYGPIIVAFWGLITNVIRKLIDKPVEKATGVAL